MRKFFPCFGEPPDPEPPDPEPPDPEPPDHTREHSTPISLSPPPPLSFSLSLSNSPSLYTSLPTTQEHYTTRILNQETLRPTTPPCTNYDQLAAQVSAISLSLVQETVERKSDARAFTSAMQNMSSGIDELKRDARERTHQDAYIARLEVENSQLRERNVQLELQQRSSGATRLLDRSVMSLPSFATQVTSSSPLGDISGGDLDKSLSPPEPRIRGKNLRSTDQCKLPVRFW